MGNSSSALPYSIDRQVGAPHDHNGWALHEGRSTTDGSRVSVFVGKKPALAKTPVGPRFPQMMQLQPAYHHFQNSRRYRHPQVLKVFATLDTDNPNASASAAAETASATGSSAKVPSSTAGDLIIVTEPCTPLSQWLLAAPSQEEIAWGLECIVRGLHFMHSSAKVAHGNVSPTSFYVTPAGDVKVWNFNLVTPIGNNLGPTHHFQEWDAPVCPDAYRSPERLEQRWEAVSAAGVHAMDSYSLGILIDHIYNGRIPQKLQKAVQRLQTGNIRMRPRLQPLLKCPVFDTALQKTHLQIEEIVVQPVEQKISMWQTLTNQLINGHIQQPVAVHKLLPILRSNLQNICSNDAMLSQDLYRREVLAMLHPMLHIMENYLGSDEIEKQLSPLVGMLFVVKDRGVRGALLSKVSFMTQHLDKNTLNQSVFEPLCSGFADSSSALRELTLKATAELVAYLNQPNLEKLSRYLVRLQGDNETSIRTNAVIFIGRLAPNLTEISREKLLLPAFARAFKDVFAPCRKAALQAMLKTKDFFTVTALANKVLPSLMPMLLDPVTEIRNDAFQVVEAFMGLLRQESVRMATIAQQEQLKQQQQQRQTIGQVAPAPATASAAMPPGAAVSVAPAPTSGGYLSGLSSWMSTSAAASATAASPTETNPMAAAPANTLVNDIAATRQKFAATNVDSPSPVAAATVDDGWGEIDDDDDDDDDDNWDDANDGVHNNLDSSAPGNSFTFGENSTNDDPFASIGSTPIRRLGGSSSKGKLVLSKKKQTTPVVQKVSAPATKLAMDDDDIADGWDDF